VHKKLFSVHCRQKCYIFRKLPILIKITLLLSFFPSRNSIYGRINPAHIFSQHMAQARENLFLLKWYKRIAWGPFTTLVILPVCGLISTFWVRLYSQTAIFALVYAVIIALCITAGKLAIASAILIRSKKLTETRIPSIMVSQVVCCINTTEGSSCSDWCSWNARSYQMVGSRASCPSPIH
jgi:hypothetical protein